jgi:hypothetical protein
MAWSDAGNEVFLPTVTSRGPGRLWRGKVALTGTPAPPGTRRLLIREYEYFFTDWDSEIHGQEFVSVVTPGAPAGFVRSRVVYVDTFAI